MKKIKAYRSRRTLIFFISYLFNLFTEPLVYAQAAGTN